MSDWLPRTLPYQLTFESPWWLLLLALIPALWVFSYTSLAGLGPIRRIVALTLRTAVMLLIIFSLAETQLERTSQKMTVIYVLDQSESVPKPERDAMLEYVIKSVAKHRQADREDRAGIIVFGRDAKIEIPPFDDDIPSIGSLETLVDLRTDATNLAAALKLAQASFPEDAAKRVVIVTDGNENMGDARTVAKMLADAGVGVDVVPILLDRTKEVIVEKVVIPSDVRKGQPLETRVVVSNYSQPRAGDDGVVRGRLTLTRQIGQHVELLNPDEEGQLVDLKPGKNVFRFPHQIDQAAVYTYQADFTPLDAKDDSITQNNRASAFTHVRGQGRILLIEDWDNKGNFDYLVQRLRANNLEVEVQTSDQLFSSLAELQGYDTVILADVPRSSGDDANRVTNFSDEQIEMLVRNTQQMGCGLVMIGGQNSYGAGGWANTDLEKAMPVDFQIKNTKVQAVGALALLMHASELADGNYWQKVTAQEAIKALGPMDYCGLINWNGTEQWLWGAPQGVIRVENKRQMMLARLGRMQPGDMPDFDPSLRMALTALNRVPASVKHMIVISDGDPSPPSFITVQRIAAAGIKISTVAIGTHGPPGSTPLQNLATQTGGKYYVVNNPKALPRIYQREARRVARPLVYEPEGGVTPQVTYPHEMLQGVTSLPPIRGFVMTTVKDNPLVEVAIRSPKPAQQENSTVLASWTYGIGRAVALTTDAGHRWANEWTDWENYDKLFTQMIRWSMRPSGDEGKFLVDTEHEDGKVRLVVTALDKDDEFLNFLNISAAAVDPDLQAFEVNVKQTAPGRYVGEFEASKDGSYFLTISPGPGKAPILAGVNVPYSAEYRDRDSNLGLIESLASQKPQRGAPGKVIEGAVARGQVDDLLEVDTFRHDLAKAVSTQDIWPLLVLIGACLFLGDVFVRRVTIGFGWLAAGWAWARKRLFGAADEQAADERLARLRTRKAEIAESIDERRAAARFEPQMDDASRELDDVLKDVGGGGAAAPPPRTAAGGASMSPAAKEEEDYATRLRRAKEEAWKRRQTDKNK